MFQTFGYVVRNRQKLQTGCRLLAKGTILYTAASFATSSCTVASALAPPQQQSSSNQSSGEHAHSSHIAPITPAKNTQHIRAWFYKVVWWCKFARRLCYLSLVFTPLILATPLTFVPSFRPVWLWMLKQTIEWAGPIWIKLGQWMSHRRDLFPPILIQYLIDLRSTAPVHTYKYTKQLVRESFGKEIKEIFSEFDAEPIASGSIAQVYRAKLVSDPTKNVAVKVRHPGVVEQMDLDLHIIFYIANSMSSMVPGLGWMQLPVTLDQFRTILINQMDFSIEAEHLKRFRRNFHKIPEITFPCPIDPFVSEAVLVETFETGYPLSYFIEKSHPQNPAIAQLGLKSFYQMLFVDNFIHADCHAGNIMVKIPSVEQQQKDANHQPELVLIDVGMVTELSQHDRANFITLWRNVVNKDATGCANLFLGLSNTKDQMTESDRVDFLRDMDNLFVTTLKTPLSELRMGDVLSDMLSLVRKHHMNIQGDFATLLVNMVVLEGLAKELDPKVNIVGAAGPYLFSKVVRKIFSDMLGYT